LLLAIIGHQRKGKIHRLKEGLGGREATLSEEGRDGEKEQGSDPRGKKGKLEPVHGKGIESQTTTND